LEKLIVKSEPEHTGLAVARVAVNTFAALIVTEDVAVCAGQPLAAASVLVMVYVPGVLAVKFI
jgi:hypothetical protein